MSATLNSITPSWSATEKFLFRFFALFFVIQSLPVDGRFFKQVFSLTQHKLKYNDIFNLAHYSPRFFPGADSFANWGIVLVIAFAGALIWSYVDKSAREYNRLYYWVRVIVRYRLAIALIAYGFIKFFPIQAPYPSLSNLNTSYGDFNRWKLFSLSLGIVPSYQSFLGLVEIVIGILLLFRTTATIGAFLTVIFTGNVFMSNLGYEGGEYVYSFYLISFALFLVVFDLQRIISLLVLQKPTVPNRYKPEFRGKWQQYGRLTFKVFVIFFFVVLYGFKTRSGLYEGLTLYPGTKGLPGAAGVYNVSEFKINNNSHPYSKTDPVRWQNVVFEKWNTISVKSNRPVIIDSSNVTLISANDEERLYELEGSAERHYYSYKADTINHTLVLQNKNKNHKGETWVLLYQTLGNNGFILSGRSPEQDSVYVVLEKINKKYLVEEAAKLGRRSKLKL